MCLARPVKSHEMCNLVDTTYVPTILNIWHLGMATVMGWPKLIVMFACGNTAEANICHYHHTWEFTCMSMSFPLSLYVYVFKTSCGDMIYDEST